ncbi:hypothetical protein LTS15_000099 [Exophiala xenobiotica]|nr:hypothetical protein LTS15_000099 [Exophiala xenobiotica]
MAVNLGPLGQQSLASTALITVGAITIASIAFTTLRVLLSTFVLPGKSLSSYGRKGSWAVVTGSSDGIGREYALQLAKKGFNLILVSRTASKLESLASEIRKASPNTEVEILAMDFSQNRDSDYTSLASLVQRKQVSILINNVGQSHSIPVTFAETSLSEMSNIININCLGTLRVTQTVLPSMVPHKKGLILTMGSFGGLTPTPLLATYSGSKAFLQQWSTALASELSSKGIDVFFVHSYLVTSAMSKIRRANWQVPTEKAFVKSVLAKIGRRGGSIGYAYSGTPYWSHALVAALITGVLGPMNSMLLQFNRKMHVDIRTRALRKAEREAQKGKKET